ncbi:chitin synthase-domain-containing protein [Blastocladiella britannica]|nr:chitin synthase-domain-containing protein [Blastocladiella britannica]
MYRIRSHNKSTPLLVSNDMIQDYGETKVDTLHKKNLLHLGEDRYLTTLMLKNFPRMKTIFTPDAQCITTAPDSWDVLLSQRRRWINSTIHNLVELLGIAGLCGFCCFSMRFVVLLDLVGTLVQPAILGYLGYLGYMVVIAIQSGDYAGFPVVSLLLLGVVYGLQAIIFLIKREWQHIGWMIIYIFAIPVFSFFIPVYSFWKNDDFSWGSTRIVIGEAGAKKVMLSGEEAQKFNMDMIPHRKWSEYEHEALATMHDASADHASQYSGKSGHFGNGNGGGMDRRTTIQSRSSIGSGLTLTGGGPSAASGSPRALSLGGSASDLRRVNTTRTTGTEFDPVALYLPGSSPSAAALLGGMPSDSELYSEVLRIVASADLMTMTKKSVRDELSALFGVDLTARKEFINQAIVDALQQRQ